MTCIFSKGNKWLLGLPFSQHGMSIARQATKTDLRYFACIRLTDDRLPCKLWVSEHSRRRCHANISLNDTGLRTILSPAAQATSELKTPFFTTRDFFRHRRDTLIPVTRERWGDEWWMRSQSRFVLGEFVKLWDVNMRSIATFSMHEMIKLLSPVVFSSQYSLLRAGFLSGWIHRSLLKNC